MSLFSTLRTSVSGMAAQSNALSAIGDNIANSSTTGYKEANAQFESLIGNNATSSYESGGVLTDIRYGITDQGTLQTTTSATDLAINGNGFFVVSKGGQGQFLTRAGSFVPDSNGNLVNAAGYSLMGYAVSGQNTSPSLSVVNMSTTALQAKATTSGTINANLPSSAVAATAGTTPGDSTPTTPAANVNYTDKTSMTVYDNLGQADILDIYFTKTADNSWQVQAYNHADAAPSGGFPYAKSLGQTTLAFSAATGSYTSGSPMNVAVPNGNSVAINMSSLTQLAADFSITKSQADDGSAPSKLSTVKFGADGTLTAVYANGAQLASYKIPLAIVPSPDNLTPLNGNVYQSSGTSGAAVLTAAASGGAGSILSDSLEQSTVDLATELTSMVVAQRGYEANSKVLQAASDLLSTLNRLQTN